MRRQAMETSVQELREKADELEIELLESSPSLGKAVLTQKCQVTIINENDTSDEWKLERSDSPSCPPPKAEGLVLEAAAPLTIEGIREVVKEQEGDKE